MAIYRLKYDYNQVKTKAKEANIDVDKIELEILQKNAEFKNQRQLAFVFFNLKQLLFDEISP